jgi:ubiquinone/menaquinone biosynthesis C-methylase UbiE
MNQTCEVLESPTIRESAMPVVPETAVTQISAQKLEKIAAAYASPPWWYDLRGFFILTLSYQSTLWRQIRFFERNVGTRHLEAAIGTGTLFKMILAWRRLKGKTPPSVCGFDYAAQMLAGAKKRFRKFPNVKLSVEDAAQLPYADESFDTINMANAFHCLPDPNAALREMLRVLAPNGVFCLNILIRPRGFRPLQRVAEAINAWGVKKGILVTPYDVEDLRRRFSEAGFQISHECVSGNCCEITAVKKALGPKRRF